MNIALDARFASEKTGTGKVSYNLLKNILLLDRENNYLLLCYKKNPFKEIKRDNIEVLINTWNREPAKRTIWETFNLPRILRKNKIDLFYSPENFMVAPFWRGKQIVTIHDLIPLVFPGYIKPLRRRIRFRLKVKTALKYFTKIVTISEYSKNDIVEKLNVDPSKIDIISEGADITKLPQAKADKLVMQEGVRNKYILALGGLEYRKNNSRLIKGYSKLPPHVLEQYDLVIVGGLKDKIVMYESFPKISAYIMGRIHFVGKLSDTKLAAFYQNASLLVMLSIYEGFGLPIIEAMKYGVPVVCSNLTSLPEVAGNAALVVSPDKNWKVANAMLKVLEDPKKREEMVQKGLKQSAKFKWETGAQDLINIFNTAL